MPQLAPMPWITLLMLVFLFKSIIFTSLWSHRPPQFSALSLPTPSTSSSHPWPWST